MAELKEYFQAFENEIGNDDKAYQLNLVNSVDYGFLPRPAKWLSRMKSYRILLNVFSFILRWFWYAGGAVIFFTFQCIQDYLKYRKMDSVDLKLLDRYDFGLGFSERAFEVINVNSIGKSIQCWLLLPWVQPKNDLFLHSRVINMYSLMRTSDFFLAWLYSVRAIYVCLFKNDFRPQVLQTYTAFRWFIIRFGLSRIPNGHFYTAEHFDRWSILADQIVNLMKRSGKESSLSVVQHGLLGSLTQVSGEESKQNNLFIKHKLKSVSRLYAYDQNSADIFTQQIFAPELTRIEVHFFKPQIQLQKSLLPGTSSLKILFVGHPICENFQLQLLKKMTLENSDVQLYYKPHPTSAPHQSIREQKWVVIDDKGYFPEVNLLISYPSTLVSEYAFLGIEALVHPINISANEVDTFYKELRSKMNKLSL